MKRLTVILTLLAMLIVGAVPAAAITDGDLDGNGHPYVGLMVAQAPDVDDVDEDGDTTELRPLWRCSGTLISPTLFLTAGHCTETPATHIEIWFASDVESGIPGNGYPFTGDVGGTPYTHPEYNPNAFYFRDLGVVVLDSPVTSLGYGVLPSADQSDSLSPNSKTRFTAVGYGLQKAFPSAARWKTQAQRVRMTANPYLVQINTGFTGDFSLLLSNNAHSGGTCFGDSGGPNFYANSNVIAGVTSYGLNGTCGGTGGVYRLDRSWNLSWLAGF